MSLFFVVQSCVVNGLHYVHPTTQPIEVDDEQAAPLVESGCLTPYPVRTIDTIADPEVREQLQDLTGDEPGEVFLAPTPDVAEQIEKAIVSTSKRTRRPHAED